MINNVKKQQIKVIYPHFIFQNILHLLRVKAKMWINNFYVHIDNFLINVFAISKISCAYWLLSDQVVSGLLWKTVDCTICDSIRW